MSEARRTGSETPEQDDAAVREAKKTAGPRRPEDEIAEGAGIVEAEGAVAARAEARGADGTDTARLREAHDREAGADARPWLIYRRYSFSRIAQRPSGSHVLITDPSGVIHKAVPLEVLGKRVLLVHKADASDYENALFADEPLK